MPYVKSHSELNRKLLYFSRQMAYCLPEPAPTIGTGRGVFSLLAFIRVNLACPFTEVSSLGHSPPIRVRPAEANTVAGPG